ACVVVLGRAGLPLGVIGDLRSRRAVIAFGVGLWSACTALGAAVHRFWQLMACRAMVGVGEAGYGPAAQALIAEFYWGRQRAFAIGIYSVGMALGGVLGIWLGGVLAEHYGWRDRKSTRLNSSHVKISYAVFCLKKKTKNRSWRIHYRPAISA